MTTTIAATASIYVVTLATSTIASTFITTIAITAAENKNTNVPGLKINTLKIFYVHIK